MNLMSDKENNKFSASGLRLFSFQEDTRIGTKIMRDKEIGTIDSWGPFFRVSFDLIINSFHQDELSSLLAFRGNGAICDWCKIGDRIPALFLNNKGTGRGREGEIQLSNTVENSKDYFHFKIELNHWYNIVIEQNYINGKVLKLIFT